MVQIGCIYRGSPLSMISLSTIPGIVQIPRYSTIFLQNTKKSGENSGESVEKSHQNSSPSTSGPKILQIINCRFSIINQMCKSFDSINDEYYLGC